jgi:hypothetical protein
MTNAANDNGAKKQGWSNESREAARAEREAKAYLKKANARIMMKVRGWP